MPYILLLDESSQVHEQSVYLYQSCVHLKEGAAALVDATYNYMGHNGGFSPS